MWVCGLRFWCLVGRIVVGFGVVVLVVFFCVCVLGVVIGLRV